MALFTEGKLFKKAGEGSGGGGGDQHNLGYYATQAALEEAYPTAEAGDWAIVGATDTVWIWDTDNSAWVDSDQKGQVTSVNGQTGDVVLNLLPTQTGNSGKFLTTDGTDASWSDKPVINNSTNSTSLYIKQLNNSDLTKGQSLCILGRNKGQNSTVLGYNVNNGSNGIAIGCTGDIGNNVDYAIKIGNDAGVYQSYGIALGNAARTNAINAIQIGSFGSSGNAVMNSDANTFKVANANGNFEIMSADGTIPKARLANVATVPATAPELAVADWSSNTQTITVTGVTASNVVLVSPAPASAADYAAAGIICTGQATDSLIFTCTTVPTNAITLSVVIL